MVQFNSTLTYSQYITFTGSKEQLSNIFDTMILKDKDNIFSFGFFNLQSLFKQKNKKIENIENPSINAIAWNYNNKEKITLSFELNTFRPLDFEALWLIEQHFEFIKMEAFQLNLRINSIDGLLLSPNRTSCLITKQIHDLPINVTIDTKNYKQIYIDLFEQTINKIRESDEETNFFI